MVYSDERVARLESIVDALCGKGLFKFAEQISLIMEAVGEFMQSVKTVTDYIAEMTAQYIPPEPVDLLSLEEAFQKFEKEASTVLDRNLSPREYGERLSWGSRGHRYKSRNYPYIPLFKRNLPYQKRAG